MTLSSLIVIGIAAMLVLAVGIIGFALLHQRRMFLHQLEMKKFNEEKQKELMEAVIQGEEDERKRIASELHDDIGATLASIGLFLYKAIHAPGDVAIIQESKDLLDDSIQKIRTISHKLQPTMLQQLGLQVALQSHAGVLNRSGSVITSFYARNELPKLDNNTALSLYRIVQEITNNTIKHAKPKNISIFTGLKGVDVEIIIEHDGDGMTDEMFQEQINKKGSIGLKNIINRLKTIPGKIVFYRQKENHYEIILTAPIKL